MVRIIKNSTLRTDMNAGIVIPTALRHDINPFLRKLEAHLLEERIMPSFRIMVSPGTPVPSSVKEGINSIIISPGRPGVGHRIKDGFSKCTKHTDCAVFLPDDFDHLAPAVPEFIRQISSSTSILMGAWDAHSESTLPYPSWLTEAGLSAAMSSVFFKTSLPEPEALENFVKKARDMGFWIQVYLGVIGAVSSVWPDISYKISSMFKDSAISGPGIELAIPLAAHVLDMPVSTRALPRRFEHPVHVNPENEKRFIAGRSAQFDAGTCILKTFQKAQKKDLGIDLFLERMHSKIILSSFQWPDRKIMETEWNSQIRTTY